MRLFGLGGSGALTTMNKTTSQTIAVARVLCIACVIYVHVPPYGTALTAKPDVHDLIVWFVREVVGRSSVPLLSIISGFLAARLSQEQSFQRTLGRKTMTLLVPLLAWNAMALAKDITFAPATAIPHASDLPRLLLGFDGYPRIIPLYFLRDVFLCSLLATALRIGLRLVPWVLMAALLANAVMDLDGRVFLSSAIPLFYAIGLGLGDRQWSARAIEDYRRPCLAIAVTALVLIATLPFIAPGSMIVDEGTPLAAFRLIVQRAAGAVAFWCLAAEIVRRGEHARPLLLLEPAIFFVFCSHTLIIGLIRRLLAPEAEAAQGPMTTAAFLASPLIVIAACLAALLALRLGAPGLLRLLTAGKPPRDDQLRALLQALRPARTTKATDPG